MNDAIFRIARESDAEALLKIYVPYVTETAVTFEYDVPTPEEFRARIRRTLEKYPYIVAEMDEKIIGYAYAGSFHARAAYDWAVETSIYMDKSCHGMGIGRMLYQELEKKLRLQHIINLNACIAFAENEDEYLTNGSVKFHERMGYNLAGRHTKCGYKFGKWYDIVWMEKHIGAHPDVPERVIPFSQLNEPQS